jgi:hypothetical protein
MRPGQHNNKNRGRGRNRGRHGGGGGGSNNGGGNPANRVYDSNGPDVKFRGTAQTIAEKYMQLGRDAQASGDSVMAESYYQHSEHYYRIWLANQPAGQPIQFARRGEEEFEEEAAQEGPEGEEDGAPGEAAEGEAAEASEGASGEEPGDAAPASEDGQQQQGRPFRQREFRDSRNDRDGQQREGRDGQREGGGRERFRPRWPRRDRDRDRNFDGSRDNAHRDSQYNGREPHAQSDAPERGNEAPEADSGNWEAPSFLTRPVPAQAVEDAGHETPAPERRPAREPRARRSREEPVSEPTEIDTKE